MQKNDNTPRKGAMYLRKSQADIEKERIGKFETLARHEAEMCELSKRLEKPVDDVYKELVSGESIAARTEFKKLMANVKAKKYGYVYVHAVDRLGRGEPEEYGWVLARFKYAKTLIITPGKTYDPTDKYDMRQLELQMMFSSIEYEIIKERFKSGKEASIRDGQYIASRSPFGYDKCVSADRKKTLRINDDAETVAEIYERVAACEPKSTVARDLNSRGVLSSLGRDWTPTAIMQLVRNPVYKGYVQWNATEIEVEDREDMVPKKVRRKTGNPMVEKGLHEAIVSEELWQEANDNMIVSPRVKHGYELRNPLARVMVCKECGLAIDYNASGTGPRGKRSAAYRHKQFSTCPCRGIKVRKYDLVIDAVAAALSDTAAEYELRVTEGDDGKGEHEHRLGEMRKAAAECERKMSRLVELYMAEAIDLGEFRDRRSPIEHRMATIASAIEKEEEFVPRPMREIAMQLRDAVSLLADDGVSAQEKNNAICSVVKRIDYSEVDGELVLEVHVRE